MLSKEDYSDYLTELITIEKNMINAYRECARISDNERVRTVCLKLLDDETRHASLLDDLMRLMALAK